MEEDRETNHAKREYESSLEYLAMRAKQMRLDKFKFEGEFITIGRAKELMKKGVA